MTKEIICTVCPKGCHVTVFEEGSNPPTQGNECIRGQHYALQEIKQALRMFTSTVAVKQGELLRCPVMTSQTIPKERVLELAKWVEKLEIKAPIEMDSVVVSNVLNLGVNLIATRSIKKK